MRRALNVTINSLYLSLMLLVTSEDRGVPQSWRFVNILLDKNV